MKLNGSFSSAFRRAVTFFPAPGVVVDFAGSQLKPAGFSSVSFDPPIVALTFPHTAPALPDKDFTVSSVAANPNGAVPARLTCAPFESREIGDHRMILASVQRVEICGGSPLVHWRRASFHLRLDYPFLASDDALEAFVNDWHSGGLPKSSWTHAAHVGVTGYYAFDRDPETVYKEMKRGILHFNTFTGVVNGPDSGYHETLTRFWSNTITQSIRDAGPGSRLEAAKCAVRLFGEDRDIPFLFYSFDVVRDRRARAEWVPPDLSPLPEWCGV